MRKIDKLKQIEKANLLAEQRFMESKSIVNEEDYSDGDQAAAEYEGYYNAIVGDDEGMFFAHYNTKEEALTAILNSAYGSGASMGTYFKPHILSKVILNILSKVG